VLACLLGSPIDEAVLRVAFAEAERRAVSLRVVAAGPAAADAQSVDLIERWAEKYPAVPVITMIRPGLDPAVVLTAATRGQGLAVVPKPSDAKSEAALRALARRTHCPLIIAAEAPSPVATV
jgi:hypothetical protein